MPTSSAAEDLLVSLAVQHAPTTTLVIAGVCLVWYVAVAFVCSIGTLQLWRNYSRPRLAALWGDDAPDVTVIRPIKGLEPCLYECLASTFRQTFPREKLHIRFCIADRREPSLPILERLVQDFPEHDAQILVEEEDASLRNGTLQLGPNPKIRNMSRAYREAPGDIVWVLDCNVWVAKGTVGRMVARLDGAGSMHKNKFVHQLPLVVDTEGSTMMDETHGLNGNANRDLSTTLPSDQRTASAIGGGRLEEVFMSSSHAKFYTAINTVLIAPCIVGKSTMFRRSHLGSLTNGQGIDFFSQNICEDHLIGDLLWKQKVPEEVAGEVWGKHAMLFGDLAVQPMANMSVREYWSRRVRWLRVRKFTVTLATLVEPGTESFLCSAYGAWAFTTLPLFHDKLAIPQTWTVFSLIWLLSVSTWCAMDRILYLHLHSAKSIEVDDHTPSFARPPKAGRGRVFGEWLLAWLGRETLALPIWVWAFWGGTKVQWRNRKFWVGMDMKVHEIRDDDERVNGEATRGHVKAK
ncbi:Ceramide glucosyltransferase [Friedmanniomyces endolithicus]|nr:Ceramide glucosyltransferase [Friedmanniomyces endolithicus]KAK0796582.1 Ceramide glucosyltransferase [Friedmanniomyces endolithicus]KAK0819801.1 Ceramide glucosyltransferase [Friedmanniomyces endolithicus]KAK0821959.1 Ceramide glucosyltransferase [Friedmanniomyces endolithicus]KAK0845949.1 Ceramide glucosyltransferase [Friedmanniomyces endolithicus]